MIESLLLRKRLPAGAVLAVILPLQGMAQSHSAFPVDIRMGPAPQPFTADGRSRLLDVLGGDAKEPLARYRGDTLEKLLIAVGPQRGDLPAGRQRGSELALNASPSML